MIFKRSKIKACSTGVELEGYITCEYNEILISEVYMMSFLEVENLTKTFGGLTAVDKVSFELKKGEILGLIGPNGAGKTTVLKDTVRFT